MNCQNKCFNWLAPKFGRAELKASIFGIKNMQPGKRLNRARKLCGYSVIQVSKKTGISPRRIWRLEKGADPRVFEIQKLCNALKMSADWWLRGDESAAELICRRVGEMPKRHREAILLVLDLLKEDRKS